MRSFVVVTFLSFIAQAYGKVPMSKLVGQQNPGKLRGISAAANVRPGEGIARAATFPFPMPQQSMPQNLKDEPKLYEMWRTSDKDSIKSPAEAAIAAIANLDKVKQLGDTERVVNPLSFAALAAVLAIYLVPGLALEMTLDPEQITMGLPAAGTAAVAGSTMLNLFKNGAVEESIREAQLALKGLDRNAQSSIFHTKEAKAALKKLGLMMAYSPNYADPQAAVEDAAAAVIKLQNAYLSSGAAGIAMPEKKIVPALKEAVVAVLEAAEAKEAAGEQKESSELVAQSTTNVTAFSGAVMVALVGVVASVVLFLVLHFRRKDSKTGKVSLLLE